MIRLTDFFVLDGQPDRLITGAYDPWLVTLSVLVAIGAAYMALALASAARTSQFAAMRRLHLVTGAACLGLGIWSMHFIGMLAFELPVQVHYHPWVTALSAVPSILASGVALGLLANHELNDTRLAGGGLVVGAGIGCMHYLGMAAMEIGPSLRYDPYLFVISILVAVLLGTLSLWISFGLRARKRVNGKLCRLMAAVVMGVAIAGMHYTAMKAARFIGTPDPDFQPGSNRHVMLAGMIAFVTVSLSLMAAGVNVLASYRNLLQRSREAHNEIRGMWDAAVDGIIKISPAGTVLSFNESAERIFGYAASEVIGRNVSMLMPEPHRRHHDSYIQAYLSTGERKIIGSSREVFALHKDGRKIPVRLAVGESRTGGTVVFVGFVTDMSERYAMEAELRRAKRQAEEASAAKSAFLANVSHEIRTPMNAIIGFTEIVLDTPLSDAQRHHLTIVRNSAKSLLALLNDILDTAKLESGNLSLEEADFSLRQVCEQVVATHQVQASRKGIGLQLKYQARDVYKGDAFRLRQILMNLVSNAVKFTEKGQVQVCVSHEPGRDVRIDVIDTGIGIPQDRLESIFEPFIQADSSMTRRFGGTGLGMAICRQLVTLMNGRIRVVSTAGQGSCFTVELPLPEGDPARVGPPEDDSPVITLPPLHILVVDDVPQNLELLNTLLKKWGHSVTLARSGKEAVSLYMQEEVDLILMDIQMPGMNGHDATRRIREIEAQQGRHRIPVIALTASVMAEDRDAAENAGMDGFATKPVRPAELVREMARVLGYGPGGDQDDMTETRLSDPDMSVIHELWPDAAAHLSAVRRFIEQAEAFLRCPETQGGMAAALHKLRGVAANLGFVRLAEQLGEAERLAKSGLLLTSETLSGLHEGVEAARQWLERQEAPDAPAGQAAEPGELDDTLLQEVIRRLRQGEIPEQSLARLLARLPHSLQQQIARALDEFDMDLAAELLAGHAGKQENA